MMYKLYRAGGSKEPNAAVTINVEPQVSFIFDPDNRHYQEYLAWLAEGNEPLPADPLPPSWPLPADDLAT